MSNLNPLAFPALEYLRLMRADIRNLGEHSLQKLYSDASKIDLGYRLIPLPRTEEPSWIASPLAEEVEKLAQVLGGYQS